MAGRFETIGSRSVKGIARWNGERWESVGNLPTDWVEDIAFSPSGRLYAADAQPNIFWLDRSTGTWNELDPTAIFRAGVLAFDRHGTLFAGGEESTAGGTLAVTGRIAVPRDQETVGYVIKWDAR